MLSKRLEALSKDPSNPDSIAELVVTALGPQGSFYICWKTVSGRHEQDSHGLPAALHEWLFPPDGSRRDFETLQVILGPREGEFFASDRHGRREQKPAEPAAAPPPQQPSPLAGRLRRASTLWQQQQRQQRDPANHKRLSFIEDPERQPAVSATTTAAANKRLSFLGDTAVEAPGQRRRSATLSSLGWASASRRTLSLPKVPLDPAEPEDPRRARRTTLLPLALQAGGPAPFAGTNSSNTYNREAAAATATAAAPASRRSASPPSRGPSRAGSLRASASHHAPSLAAARESAGGACPPERRRTPPRPSIPEEEPLTPRPAARRPVSVYADAGIQTDPVPEDDALSDYPHPHSRRRYDDDDDDDDEDGGFGAARRARGLSTASETSTVFSRAATATSSRRTSMESDVKLDPAAAAPCWLERQQQRLQQQQQEREQEEKEQLQQQQQQQWQRQAAEAANFNPNPVVMGRMQDYFRSPAYCLGDAFRPTLGSGMYWGSWRQ